MAEVVVDSSEDAIRLFDQGNRILNLTSNNSSDASRFEFFTNNKIVMTIKPKITLMIQISL